MEISVVLAVYNGSLYLREAIDSILSQTFKDFELIIINDGSTDSTSEIILSYNDPRIVYIDNKVNRRLIYSLNKGLSESRGKYIARMDADDVAFPERFRIQYDFMEKHPEIGICGTNIETFFEETKKRQIIRFPKDDKTIRAYTYFQSPFCHPTVMMRRDVIEKNKLQYSTDFIHTEDYAMWIEILKYTSAYNIQQPLLRYRRHEGSVVWMTEKNNKKNVTASRIQGIYAAQNGISMDAAHLFPFSCFVNRSMYYQLSLENQQMLDPVFRDFFCQLAKNQKYLVSKSREFVSTACFYRFFRAKKYPSTPFLRKLYFWGAFVFLKRIFIFAGRMTERLIMNKQKI
jgi:glycosyltransferase involved in cell wall biosynthesis